MVFAGGGISPTTSRPRSEGLRWKVERPVYLSLRNATRRWVFKHHVTRSAVNAEKLMGLHVATRALKLAKLIG